MFQSAPLTDVRGDIAAFVNPVNWPAFQSAPLTDVRGDGFERELALISISFNPLPSLM